MDDLAAFIRDWIPSLAIIAAGCWAIFNWFHQERLRRSKESPAAEGELRLRDSPIGDGKRWVIIEACWRNTGPVPFPVDTENTVIHVFPIAPAIGLGPVNPKAVSDHLGDPEFELRPYQGSRSLTLEPSTQSVLQHNFVLRQDRGYLVWWRLRRLGEAGRTFTRTRYLFIPPSEAPNAPGGSPPV